MYKTGKNHINYVKLKNIFIESINNNKLIKILYRNIAANLRSFSGNSVIYIFSIIYFCRYIESFISKSKSL